MADGNWRAGHTVLVTDAHAIGALAVIRSLGRAGYRVLASARQPSAIGMSSRFCHLALSQPADPAELADWLQRLVDEHGLTLVVPSEGFLLDIRPNFARFQPLLPVPSSEAETYAGLSKCELFSRSAALGLTEGLPPYLLIEAVNNLPDLTAFRKLGSPVYIKVDATYARLHGGEARVLRCFDPEQARDQVETMLRQYHRVLVQGHVEGVGVGAFLARWQGRELASFMHRRLHEVPHTGGASSYRRAWRDDAILADARRRMEGLGWEGVGMFEYRWNPANGHFQLLEFNSRFWGSLHLALFAGVDFPSLLADAFHGRPAATVSTYDEEARARLTFPGELSYVLSCARDQRLSWSKRLWPLLEFFLLVLDPRVRSDLLFPGDRALYWPMMCQALRNLIRR